MISINSSAQVLAFLPENTWTEVILLSSTSNNNDVYLVTTEDRVKKKLEDMQKMSKQISMYKEIKVFKPLEMVAVEVEGKWHRGKLLTFNEFKSNNTRIELVDVGSVYETKLQNVLSLPYYFKYDPLVLPVKFKNFTPQTKKLSIKPLLSESNILEGVLVDVNYSNGMEVKDSLIKEQCLNKTNGSYLSKSLRRGLQKPKDIPLNSGDCCIVTFIENFSKVYVGKAVKQVKDNTYEICNFDIVVKTAQSTDEMWLCNPNVGDTVKVITPTFRSLRAKILKNNNNGNYNVFYIDYGNIETVSINDIYELSDELKKEPGLAIEVGLAGLNDITFTKKIKCEFDNFINNKKPFIIEFYDTFENCLKNVELKDVENELYIYNYVMNWLPMDPDYKKPIQTIENNTTTDGHNINQSNSLKNNDTVYLKHFEDMDSVYIVKDEKMFDNIMLSIQEKSSVCKTNFNVGDIVKVHSTSYSYRAKINKIDGNSISVLNIDYGYCDIVQKDSIYELPSELKKIPGLALKVGITKPILNKTRALTEFICNVEKVPLYLEYDINQDITLRRKDNSENIFQIFEFFDEILKAGHSISNDILKNSEQDQITNKKNESLTNDFKYISLENGDYCMISYFEDFKNIYICKAIINNSNNGPDYTTHNDVTVLKTLICQDRKTKTNISIGDVVKVFSLSFEGFYRAKILSIKNNDEFYVQYIDFGSTEVVKSNNIFELSDELKKENPLLPVRVSIEVPPNAKISAEIKEMFQKLIDNIVVLSIEYKTKSNDRLENVLLKELNSGKSINGEVLKLLSVEKVPLKNGDSCILSHFEDLDCIYVYSIPFISENVKLITERISGRDRVIKTNPVVGDIVQVHSSKFNDFFRAKILDIVNNADFHVFYIDYGNTEVVKSDDIFELVDNLKIKPGLAIKVGINMPNNIQKNEEITKMFHRLVETTEILSIEFDESSEDGLKNCILKLSSNGLIINKEVLKLSPIQSSIALKKGHGSPNGGL